ncbi:MAG: general secretion pathway protein GspL [Nitrosomonadales bacterium]|nr:general secretion pathway protein GspL [Nitrosomonadales bacterium]
MSTLYIRLPSRASADSAPDRLALACPFALVAHGKTIARQGTEPLANLSAAIAQAQRVVLLLAASDVTLLRVKVPPLSPARLKAALPNLVEDQLLGDPSDCAIVAGGSSDGLRTIAAVRRDWLELLAGTLLAYGARRIAAVPAQLCLPAQPGIVSAAISVHDAGIDMTLRLSEQEGIGLALNAARHDTVAHEAINALCATVPAAQITLYVPQALLPACQNEISQSGNQRITVAADDWSHWVAGAEAATLDLMAGQNAGGNSTLNLRAWRWPLALATAVLLVNIAALNLEWLRMKREADALRATMMQTYKSAYPKDTVIIDPIAQMQQKIIAAKRGSGLAAPDDFTAIMAAFGEAWTGTAPAGKAAAIAAFEYRDRGLFVRLKPGAEAPSQQMKTALAARNLSLELSPAQSSGAVWEIRSAR